MALWSGMLSNSSRPLLNQTVEKLLRVMRPGGIILAFFNANEKIKEIPLYSYRIKDAKTLLEIYQAASRNTCRTSTTGPSKRSSNPPPPSSFPDPR